MGIKKFIHLGLSTLMLFALSNKAHAQLLADIEGMPPYKLGLTAGYNMSSFSADKFDMISGFNIGADLMLDASEFIKDTYVRVNLLVQQKGSKFRWRYLYPSYDVSSGDVFSTDVIAKARIYYIELPIYYGFARRLNKEWSLFGETGPYLSWGLAGHYHSPGYKKTAHPENSYIKFFNNNITEPEGKKAIVVHSPKRRDLGWGFAIGGIFLNTHQIKVGYQCGFFNMNDEFQQNRNLMINYTYFFE